MIKNVLTLVFSILLVPITTNCQLNSQPLHSSYSVDLNLKDSIEKNLKIDGDFNSSTIYISMFSGDSSLLDTYSLGNGLNGMCIAGSYLSGDTITTVGFWGTIFYRAKMSKTSCQVSCTVSTDEKVYKFKKDDRLNYKLTLQCEKYTLTLLKDPIFKKGEIIEGIIDFTTDDFLQKIDKAEVKLQIHMTGYFKTKVGDKDIYLDSL